MQLAKKFVLPSALGISVGLVFAASRFEREAPASEVAPAGISVSKDGVALTRDAPQWKVLRVGPAAPLGAYATDAVPARVKIDESRASKVGSPLPGRVTRVQVELGQRVKAGTPLFSVASPEIASLRADEDKAAVDLDAARVNLERVKAMVEARALPAKELTFAANQLKQAEVSARAAAAKIAALSIAEDAGGFTVAATRDGVVVEKNVLPGQEVSPEAGGALVVLADLSSVWVLAELFEADATSIREGSQAHVSSPSLPGKTLEGTVEMVSAIVDPERHTVPIRIHVENPERLLRPNVYAEVRIAVPPPPGAVEVPATALVTDGSHQYVYVEASSGHFVRREIVAASTHDGRVAILSGLKSGEAVVEEGAILLDNQLALAN